MSTFNRTFDRTFTGVLNPPPLEVIAPDVCRGEGIYLSWLTDRGWVYWLFDGKFKTELSTVSRGSVKKAGLTMHNKETSIVQVARGYNLTKRQVETLSSIYSSSIVCLIDVNKRSKFRLRLVTIDPGVFPVTESDKNFNTMEVRFSLTPRLNQII